jgi:outer membrane lipoprotein SlyB
MHRFIAAAVAISMVAGCATAPPNTPGAGSGDAYTPVIDMQGLDMARYSADLEGCRGYARQLDPNKKAMEALIGGIVLGALVGAAVGGNRYQAEHGAIYGGTAGVTAGGARAVLKQETIMANCMAGRGYRVLSGATIATNSTAPSPYADAQQRTAPAQYSTPTTSSAIPGCGWVGYQWKCN